MSLKVENLTFAYKNHPVLKGVDFEAEKGEMISVLGPNGVGKSTLFKCMLGLLVPDGGSICIDGESITGLTPQELSRKMAYIPQFHAPVFNYSVLDMVLLGTTAQISRFSVPGARQVEVAEQALDTLHISFLKDRGYANISGGERQMVLIARAIAQQAGILVMDEPSASLDFGNRIRLMKTVRELTGQGYTVIQSTHDPEQAYNYSDKVLAIMDGKSLKYGTPKEVITPEAISMLYGMPIDVVTVKEKTVSCLPQ